MTPTQELIAWLRNAAAEGILRRDLYTSTADRLAEQEAEIERLRKTLEPFAALADFQSDLVYAETYHCLTARAALEPKP